MRERQLAMLGAPRARRARRGRIVGPRGALTKASAGRSAVRIGDRGLQRCQVDSDIPSVPAKMSFASLMALDDACAGTATAAGAMLLLVLMAALFRLCVCACVCEGGSALSGSARRVRVCAQQGARWV